MDNKTLKPVQNVKFKNIAELYRCYMPFIKGGGLFFHFNHEITINNIEPGETIVAMINLPNSSETFTIKGEVVWINQSTINKGYGISISNIGDNTGNNIKELIENLINDPSLRNEKRYTF